MDNPWETRGDSLYNRFMRRSELRGRCILVPVLKEEPRGTMTVLDENREPLPDPDPEPEPSVYVTFNRLRLTIERTPEQRQEDEARFRRIMSSLMLY